MKGFVRLGDVVGEGMKRQMRVWMKAVAVIAVLAASSTMHAGDYGTLAGTVTDPTGVVFRNANVWIRWNDTSGLMGEGRKAYPPKQREMHLRTDANGQFSLKIEAGIYDVFVYADAYVPVCNTVAVEAGATRELKLHIPRWAGPME